MPTPEPDDFHQLELLFTDPLQHDYEVIRRVVDASPRFAGSPDDLVNAGEALYLG